MDRVEAIRNLLGIDQSLMIDANYSLTLDEAIKALTHFQEFDITWFEEPMDPDDLEGYKQLSQLMFP